MSSLELASPLRLDAIRPQPIDAPEGIPGFVQFTIAPHGGGFSLFRAWENAAREIPIVWFDLDQPAEPTASAYPREVIPIGCMAHECSDLCRAITREALVAHPTKCS